MNVSRLQLCEIDKNYTITLEKDYSIQIFDKRVVQSGHFLIFEEITTPIEAYVTINRCDRAYKSCQLLVNIRLDHICQKLNDKSAIWSSFYRKIEPKFQCPLKVGSYHHKNSTVDFTSLLPFPDSLHIWLIKLKICHGTKICQKELFCINFAVEISSRKKEKSIKTTDFF